LAEPLAEPWFTGMGRVHAGLMMAMEVLPLTLLLLPAAQGVVTGIAQLYAQVHAKDANPGKPTVAVCVREEPTQQRSEAIAQAKVQTLRARHS
jgi:hypothetical protein